MKKNWMNGTDPLIGLFRKLFLIMRLSFVISFCCLLQVSASTYSQNTRLDISLENASVKKLFKDIKKQSEFTFVYNVDDIEDIGNVNCDFSKSTVEEILNHCLEGTEMTYEVREKVIIITPIEKSKSEHKQLIDEPQKKTIKGKVTDEKGEPLPGVSIVVKGTAIGSTTNVDGNYSLEIPDEAEILVFSFIGMKSQEQIIANQEQINVLLKNETYGLEEVVAVGYGTMRKSDITGSIAIVSAERIVNNNPVNIAQGLQGKVAGVSITSGSGDPGAGSSITIRGANSVVAGTNPLFVIDGIQYNPNDSEIASSSKGSGNSSNPLDFINPADIESISILKDASATAIYGSQGANGVILIQTKKGAGPDGKSIVSFDMYAGFNEASRKMAVLSGNEFIEYRREVNPNGYMFFYQSDPTRPRDPYALQQHDWQDEILRTGFKQNYDLSLRARSGKTNYSVSLGFLDNEAIVKNNDNQRITTRINISHQKSEKLKIGFNSSGSYSVINGATQSGGGSNLFNGIVQNLVVSTPVELHNPSFDPSSKYISPASMIDEAYREAATMNFNSNVFLHYSFNDNLKLILKSAGSLKSSKGTEFYGKDTNWGTATDGYAHINESKAVAYNGSAQLHYTKEIGILHKLNAFVASEFNNYDFEKFSVTSTNFLDESTGPFDISKGSIISDASSYKNVTKRVSFFGRVNYIYNNKHAITTTLRADGSDKFGPDNRWGYFPSAAYSWLIIDKGQSFTNYAKLRLSFGISGNDRIPSYQYLATLDNTYYDGVLGMSPGSQANDDLKWETTRQFNAGFDFGFFDNTLTTSIDIYQKETSDMLINTPTAGRTGYFSQWQNIGRIDNKGIEFQLSSVNINKNDFKWTTDFNISHNKNTVVDLGAVGFIDVRIPGGWIKDIGRVKEGGSIGEAYGYEFDGIYQMSEFTWQNDSDPGIPTNERVYVLNDGVVSVGGINAKPGSHKFKDVDGDGEINLDDDRNSISRSDPVIFGGLTNTFKYKNFDLNFFFEGAYGNEIFNESKFRLEGAFYGTHMNVTKDFYYNHWTLDNPSNTLGTYANDNATAQLASSYYVEDASYVRFKSLAFGYTFNNSVLSSLKLEKLRIYISGNNLYTWTKYTGFDPETHSGIALMKGTDNLTYPRAKTILVGLNLTF